MDFVTDKITRTYSIKVFKKPEPPKIEQPIQQEDPEPVMIVEPPLIVEPEEEKVDECQQVPLEPVQY